MDTGTPEIKPEVNKEEDRKSGMLGSLLSKLGGSGAGAGGVGGLGAGAGGTGLMGGLLATKAGIIGLVLIGTTVAGGLGVVGYKAFGPGSDQAGGGYSSLFEARPPSAESSSSGSAASADGTSQSLDMMVKANSGASGEQAGSAPDAAKTEQMSDAAGANGAASASAATPKAAANNNAPAMGAAAKLAGAKKFGELAKIGSTGGGSGGGSGASSGGAGTGLLASAKTGGLGGFAGGPRAAGGSNRGIGNIRKAGSALKQLGNVRADQRRAGSSAQAGRTYDAGSDSTGGEIAGENTGAAGPGAGAAAVKDKGPSANSSGAGDERFPPPPDDVEGENVTPWQAAINTAILLVAGAAALLFLAGKVAKAVVPPASMAVAYTLAALAGLMGLAVIALGSMIGGGEFGQPLQGGLLTLAGAFITATAAVAIFGGESGLAPGQDPGTMMMICGGAGLAAAAGAYMMTPKSFPAADFKDGRPPDWDNKFEAKPEEDAYMPSENALQRYLAAGPYTENGQGRA